MPRQTDDLELSIIKQIEIRASEKSDVVSLAQGIPSFDTPDFIKNKVIEYIQSGRVAKYSLAPGLLELRELIEESLELERMYYDFETEIIVTAGSIEALTATFLTILSPNDEVILLSPSYVSYLQSILIAKGHPVYVSLNEADGWSIDIDKINKAITNKTKAILICNPNNPTGTVYSKKDLLSLANIAEQNNLIIITDEVYKDFIFDKETRETYFSIAEESKYRDRIVRIYSFSKAYAMTGWRVGYLHTEQSLAKKILAVHDTLVTCAPVVSQYAAIAALQMNQNEWKVYFDEYKTRRDLMCKKLDEITDYLDYIKSTASYFIFPRLKTQNIKHYVDSKNLTFDILDKIGLAVVPGAPFGPSGEHHLRLSFGRTQEDITKGTERLLKYFKSL